MRYTVSLAGPSESSGAMSRWNSAGAAQPNAMQLPVWNALYQVRDFSQYVTWVRARRPAGQRASGSPSRQDNLASRWSAAAVLKSSTRSSLTSPGPIGAQLNAQPRILQSGGNADVSRGRPRLSPCEFVTMFPRAGKFATALTPDRRCLHVPRTTISWWILRLKSARFKEADFDEGGGHYRVVVDADPADYDMRKISPSCSGSSPRRQVG